MIRDTHRWHIVDASPWPIVGGCGSMALTCGGVLGFHKYELGSTLMELGGLIIILAMIVWWRDVIREASYEGSHTKEVEEGIKIGMILFISSEVLFFFSFFWGFFHSSLGPVVELGLNWPPLGIISIKAFDVPLLNTAILLTSAISLTWSHHALLNSNRDHAIIGIFITILLGILFTIIQALEYYEASYTFADSVYGSIFFLATGFHGLHVIVGTLFLIVSSFRLLQQQFTSTHHFGFEASAWYWHFVDYVWLFLFVCIYWWGS